jgi:hypothetical protein
VKQEKKLQAGGKAKLAYFAGGKDLFTLKSKKTHLHKPIPKSKNLATNIKCDP